MLETARDRRQLLKAASSGTATLDGRDIDLIFDEEHEPLTTLEATFDISRITVLIVVEDLGNARKDSILRYSGADFHVEQINPDGTGMIELVVSKAE